MYKKVDYVDSFAIANIYPVANQSLYRNERYVMILSYLMDQYHKDSFRDDAYIIMDNSLYEEQQNGLDLQYYIDLAENSDIDVNEIIIPDVLNDLDATIKIFLDSKPLIEKYQDKYNFMFVSHCSSPEELQKGIDFINSQQLTNISVGFSKLSSLDRMDDNVLAILKQCKHPIHFLGIKWSFEELTKAQDFIRGCDSQQLAYIAKNEDALEDMIGYVRKGRAADGRGLVQYDVELGEDVLDSDRIAAYRTSFIKQWKKVFGRDLFGC